MRRGSHGLSGKVLIFLNFDSGSMGKVPLGNKFGTKIVTKLSDIH